MKVFFLLKAASRCRDNLRFSEKIRLNRINIFESDAKCVIQDSFAGGGKINLLHANLIKTLSVACFMRFFILIIFLEFRPKK